MFAAGARVLEAGSDARFYHIVDSGVLAVFDPVAGPQRPIAFLRAGDLFSLDCGPAVAMGCVAVFPAVVIALERHLLDDAAREIPALAALLRATHAAELSRILEHTERRRRARASVQLGFKIASDAKRRFTACARAVERGSRAPGAGPATSSSLVSRTYRKPLARRHDDAGTCGI